MFRTALFTALVALLAACGAPAPHQPPPDGGHVHQPPPADAGQPDAGTIGLLTLQGPLEVAPGAVPPSNTRLALLWFASLDTAEPQRFAAVEEGPALAEGVPTRWRFDVQSAPPAAARGAYATSGGGTGLASFGMVVAYRDLNGDQRLTLSAEGSTPDELAASTAGALPFDADGPGLRTSLLWREGTLGADEEGVQQGFNLVRATGPLDRLGVFPLSTDIALRVTNDPRLQLSFCPPAFAQPAPEYACGQLVFLTPRVSAFAFTGEGLFNMAYAQVFSGERPVRDAIVTLNGTPLLFTADDTYTLFELQPAALRTGVNQLRIEAPGLAPLTLDLTLPAAPQLLTPSANASMALDHAHPVAWAPVHGATSYVVSLYTEGAGEVSEGTEKTALDLAIPASLGTGPASLQVSSLALTAAPRHLVMGTSTTTLAVTLVP